MVDKGKSELKMKLKIVRKMALAAAFSAGLYGCTAQQKAAELKQQQIEVAQAVHTFDNQLITDGQPYAMLSAQPRQIDKQATFSPYVVRSIDGRVLEFPAYSFVKARPLPMQLAFSPLKVPAGNHLLTISGGAVKGYSTTLESGNLEAGKRYAIVERAVMKGYVVYIAEYLPDNWFDPGEREFYLLGKRVSTEVRRGESTPVPGSELPK